MILKELSILNYKNIREANLRFADKINCFVGLNGQGKTNLLDAIYYLSFTKSAFNSIDSQNIRHEEDFAMIQGSYALEDHPSEAGDIVLRSEVKEELPSEAGDTRQGEQSPTLETITCGIKRGQKKQFRRGKKDYKRLIDHIGLVPLVMVSPADQELILDGSEARRKFLDGAISQYNKPYLEHLSEYNGLLKQRNALLKQYEEHPDNLPVDLMEVLEMQMTTHAEYIFRERTDFVERFIPLFADLYHEISGGAEEVTLSYISQLQNRDLTTAYRETRGRDLILGWTSQGIHKDDLEMHLGGYPLRQVGSQGQQKTYLLSLKLAQAIFLGRPILLLDDIFDKLDAERVERIVSLVHSDRFGQIFLTDTDRQHLSEILRPHESDSRVFKVAGGEIN